MARSGGLGTRTSHHRRLERTRSWTARHSMASCSTHSGTARGAGYCGRGSASLPQPPYGLRPECGRGCPGQEAQEEGQERRSHITRPERTTPASPRCLSSVAWLAAPAVSSRPVARPATQTSRPAASKPSSLRVRIARASTHCPASSVSADERLSEAERNFSRGRPHIAIDWERVAQPAPRRTAPNPVPNLVATTGVPAVVLPRGWRW